MTDKQLEALKAIDTAEKKHGRIPHLKDVAWELNVAESTAARRVWQLKDAKVVEHKGPRTLEITDIGRRLLAELPQAVAV